jgi:hypothetical protein
MFYYKGEERREDNKIGQERKVQEKEKEKRESRRE